MSHEYAESQSGRITGIKYTDYRCELEASRSQNSKLLEALEKIADLPKVKVDQASKNPEMFSWYNEARKIARKIQNARTLVP